jgi:hypothetical protein
MFSLKGRFLQRPGKNKKKIYNVEKRIIKSGTGKHQDGAEPVLWIRIGSDPHHFAGSIGIDIGIQAYRSGSGKRDFNMLKKYTLLSIMTHLPLIRKEKHCKLPLL